MAIVLRRSSSAGMLRIERAKATFSYAVEDGDDVEGLEDEAELPSPEEGKLVLCLLPTSSPSIRMVPPSRPVNAADDVEVWSFFPNRRPSDGQEIPLLTVRLIPFRAWTATSPMT
jgi:hypothetical protein